MLFLNDERRRFNNVLVNSKYGRDVRPKQNTDFRLPNERGLVRRVAQLRPGATGVRLQAGLRPRKGTSPEAPNANPVWHTFVVFFFVTPIDSSRGCSRL